MLVHLLVDIWYKLIQRVYDNFQDFKIQHISNFGWTIPKVHHMVFMVATVKIDFIFVN